MPEIHCFYISEGLLTPNHVKRIGESIWEFLWLISHETRMGGRVLNGSPITLTRIAGELGESLHTAQRNLNRLSREGYVIKKRTARGLAYSYSIAHSKKWKRWMGDAKNGTTSDAINGTTSQSGNAKSGMRVVPQMASGDAINGTTNKELDRIDKIDSKDTTCNKCGGRGMYPQRFPSKFEDREIDQWVKCECRH